jgi:hypothetical protein
MRSRIASAPDPERDAGSAVDPDFPVIPAKIAGRRPASALERNPLMAVEPGTFGNCPAGICGNLEEFCMNKLVISLALGAGALFATAASAAPLTNGVVAVPDNGIENVRMVCNEYGRCWRERSGRRVIVEDSYGSAPRERYIERRGYYDDGPRVGVGVGPVGIGIGVGPRW